MPEWYEHAVYNTYTSPIVTYNINVSAHALWQFFCSCGYLLAIAIAVPAGTCWL